MAQIVKLIPIRLNQLTHKWVESHTADFDGYRSNVSSDVICPTKDEFDGKFMIDSEGFLGIILRPNKQNEDQFEFTRLSWLNVEFSGINQYDLPEFKISHRGHECIVYWHFYNNDIMYPIWLDGNVVKKTDRFELTLNYMSDMYRPSCDVQMYKSYYKSLVEDTINKHKARQFNRFVCWTVGLMVAFGCILGAIAILH